ncbi:MAG: ABC transporter substrate-binding protein, partial [Deltaproteobacteria bacterium]
LKVMTKEVLDGMAAKDPFTKKVYDHYMDFKKNHDAWDVISEERYAKLKHL